MLTALPVVKLAQSDARNATRSATSSGVPVRPSGLDAREAGRRGGPIDAALAHLPGDQRGQQLELDVLRTDRVDADVVARHRVGDRLGHRHHGRIGDAGRKAVGMRVARRLADDVDDAAVALAFHDRQHRLDHGEEAEHLVAQLPLQDRQRRGLDGSAQVRAGVVDQNVDATECLKRGVDELARPRLRRSRRLERRCTRPPSAERSRDRRGRAARRRARRSRPRSLPAADVRATALPIPRDAPVTIAALPRRPRSISSPRDFFCLKRDGYSMAQYWASS